MEIHLKTNDRMMIVGVTGSGKSNFLLWLLQQLKAITKFPLIIYDSQYQHAAHGEVFQNISDLATSKEQVRIYQPRDYLSREEFDIVAQWCFNHKNCVFIIENVDFYAIPRQLQKVKGLQSIIGLGRMSGVGCIMTTRRIADVDKTPCSQCTGGWAIFYTYLTNDVEYMRKHIGDVADDAQKLKNYYWIYFKDGKAKVMEPVPLME